LFKKSEETEGLVSSAIHSDAPVLFNALGYCSHPFRLAHSSTASVAAGMMLADTEEGY
jgi:hypothetical protein